MATTRPSSCSLHVFSLLIFRLERDKKVPWTWVTRHTYAQRWLHLIRTGAKKDFEVGRLIFLCSSQLVYLTFGIAFAFCMPLCRFTAQIFVHVCAIVDFSSTNSFPVGCVFFVLCRYVHTHTTVFLMWYIKWNVLNHSIFRSHSRALKILSVLNGGWRIKTPLTPHKNDK